MSEPKELMKAVRAAFNDGATPEVRRDGIAACHKLLEQLGGSSLPVNEEVRPMIIDVPVTQYNEAKPPPPPDPPAAAADPQSGSSAAPSIDLSMIASLLTSLGLTIDLSTVTAFINSLGKGPPEELMAKAITRLRAALPARTNAPPTPFRVRLVQVPPHFVPRK